MGAWRSMIGSRRVAMNPRATIAASVPSSGGRVAAKESMAARVCLVAGFGWRESSDTERTVLGSAAGEDRLTDRLVDGLGHRLVVVASQLEPAYDEVVDLIGSVGEAQCPLAGVHAG